MAESIRGQTLSREGEEEAQRPAPFFGEVILEAAILTPLRECDDCSARVNAICN